MSDVKVKVSLDNKDALKGLGEVGTAFSAVTEETKKLEKQAKAISNIMASLGGRPSAEIVKMREELKHASKNFDGLEMSAQKAAKGTEKLKTESSGAMIALKGFVTLELAKKVFAFADATIRSAKGMQSLSQATKDGAGAYADMMDNTIGIAKNVLLWGVSLAPIKGTMETLANLALAMSRAFESSADAAARIKKESDDKWQEYLNTNEGKAQMLTSARTRVRDLSALANPSGGFIGSFISGTKEEQQKRASGIAYSALKDYEKLATEIGMPAQIAKEFLGNLAMTVKDLLNREGAKSFLAVSKPSVSSAGTISTKSEFSGPTGDIVTNTSDEYEALRELARNNDLERLNAQLRYNEISIQGEIDLANEHKAIQQKKAEEDKALAKDIFDTESKLRKQAQDEQLMSLQAGFGATAQMAGALSQLATVSAGKNKELAKDALTLSQVVAVANVAEGITKAFAQGGVLGFVTGGAVGIAGLAQIATIEQQKQKLADGGIIRGPSTGDTVQVQANGGEMMLTKSDQASVLQLIRGGGSAGGGITYAPVINSSNPAQVKQMLRENKSEFESFIVSTMRNPSNSRARAFA